MNDAVRKIVIAAGVATRPVGSNQPDVFDRTSYIAFEIQDALVKAADRAVEMRVARAARNGPEMRRHTAEISRLVKQANLLVDVLATQLEK